MKDLFGKYQSQLLKLANNKYGRKFLGINSKEKIIGLTDNAYAIQKGSKINSTFRCYPVYAKRIGVALTQWDIAKEYLIRNKKIYKGLDEYRGLLNYVGLTNSSEFPNVMLASGDPIFVGSGDGHVGRATRPSWNDAHDTALGLTVDDTSTTCYIKGSRKVAPEFFCHRMLLPTDTSAIGAGAVVSAAVLSFHTESVINYGTNEYVVCQTNAVATNNIEVGDFDEVGESAGSGWSNAKQTDIIEGATRIDSVGNIRREMTLNATGLTWVDVAGVSKIGLRTSVDVDDITPVQATKEMECTIRTSEYASTENDPWLTVTYSSGGGGAFLMNFI